MFNPLFPFFVWQMKSRRVSSFFPERLSDRSGPEAPQSRVSKRRVRTVVVTNTGVDHHHRSLYESAAGTPEVHLSCGGLVRRAAAGVRALPAVSELVGLSAVAALVDEPDGTG